MNNFYFLLGTTVLRVEKKGIPANAQIESVLREIGDWELDRNCVGHDSFQIRYILPDADKHINYYADAHTAEKCCAKCKA